MNYNTHPFWIVRDGNKWVLITNPIKVQTYAEEVGSKYIYEYGCNTQLKEYWEGKCGSVEQVKWE